MDLVKLLILATVASLLFGQILRIPIGSEGAINLTDILVCISVIIFFVHSLVVKKSLNIPRNLFLPSTLFILSAILSIVLALNSFTALQTASGTIFLIRFVAYLLFPLLIYNTIAKEDIQSWINVLLAIGLIFTIIGFLQLIFVSDLTFLTQYGWDPHQKRIVSTLLDPNFSGYVFALLIAFSLNLYLFKKKLVYIFLALTFSTALLLTFSRSSYLAILAVLGIIGIFKSPKSLMLTIVGFILIFAFVPKFQSRIIGALTFDETSISRVESWKKALTIFAQNPIFGVGFNTYRYAQEREGFIEQGNLGGHSAAGTDSSILLIAATTGIVGLLFFAFLIFRIAQIFSTGLKNSYLKLASLASFIGLLIHSQFVNSLLFPQIMLMLFFILGLNLVNDS